VVEKSGEMRRKQGEEKEIERSKMVDILLQSDEKDCESGKNADFVQCDETRRKK
jgi:hypothetical protein